MMLIIGLAITAASMYCLAGTQAKHAVIMFGKSPEAAERSKRLALGWGLLILNTVLSVFIYGIGIGLVWLTAWVFACAWAVSLWLTWRKKSGKNHTEAKAK